MVGVSYVKLRAVGATNMEPLPRLYELGHISKQMCGMSTTTNSAAWYITIEVVRTNLISSIFSTNLKSKIFSQGDISLEIQDMLSRNPVNAHREIFQKCIEVVDSAHCQFVLDAFKNKVRKKNFLTNPN